MRTTSLIFMTITFLIAVSITMAIPFASIAAHMENITPEEVAETKEIIKSYEKQIKELKLKGESLAEVEAELVTARETIDSIPSDTVVFLCKFLAIIVTILALGMLILAFKKDSKLPKVVISVLVTTVVFVFVTPHIEGGDYGPASPRNLALVSACFMIVSSLCAFACYKLHLKKSIIE